MINPLQHCLILIIITLLICFFWKTPLINWNNSSVVTKSSIKVDLSLTKSSIVQQRFLNVTNKLKNFYINNNNNNNKKKRNGISRYMLQLYHRHSNADIVRALKPIYITSPVQLNGGGRIIKFNIPQFNNNEYLEAAELMSIAGMIMRVKTINNTSINSDIKKSRRDEIWRGFDVTIPVKMRNSDSLKFLVRGRVKVQSNDDGPILLLSYIKPKKRIIRSINDDDINDDSSVTQLINDVRKKKKNPCRKRPLYVDFASINYDEWIVAPPGYDAYQCVGKCFFPFSEHLNPTKHAVVQALVHGALQGMDDGKPIAKVCCVPTRLAPTSLLYLDSTGTLTYQYGYEDMVVVECGCR